MTGVDHPKVIPVKAVLRGRPLIQKEIDEGCEVCLEFIPKVNQIVLSGNKAFTFDHVFGADVGQEEVYITAVKPLTDGIFKGYHSTVLAYGQTGSGKTYSMGSAHSSATSDETTGIIPRVIDDIFTGISGSGRDFLVKVSYLELYKKDLNDLLVQVSERQPITIRDAPDGGTQLVGLTELVVTNAEETLRAMDRGSLHRTTAATAMNSVSSRSHAIFTIFLESTSKEDANDRITSKFHLVDLAGSERAKRTKAEGERLQEGIKINEGLLALGNVISALADENLRSGHIKYRDSKLTRILQSSLGGNSHTLMIACVSPADSNHEETLNTLRYADRVRKIKNKPVINRDPQAALIASLKREIQALNLRLLEGGGCGGPNASGSEKMKRLEDDNAKLTIQLQESVEIHADMCEKAIIAEMGRDRMKEQLNEILMVAKDAMDEFPDLLTVGQSLEDESMKNRCLKLVALQKLVLGLKVIEGKELLEVELTAEGLSQQPSFEGDILIANEEHEDQNMTAAYALKNADLGKQLQQLTKTLALKEELAKKMSSNDPQITAIRDQYETKLLQLDKDIQGLMKEKANLEIALEQAQKTSESRKLSEKRRHRVMELESQIQELRKEKKEKEKLIRMKSESERSIDRLNREIQEMKHNRVNLMKRIKAENEKFNAWKKEKAKEVKQLQEKNRKRNFEYVKLERTYDKQKAILRRKTEEAAAANKRLKEAMKRQQATASRRRMNERRTMEGAGPKIRAWLDEELEVSTSIKEVEHHLNELLKDRKALAQELQNRDMESPNKRRRTFCADEDSPDSTKCDELRQEMKLKNAQIQDLQNKLSEAKERHTGNSRWTPIGTMLDAKCALKYLLQVTVEAKMEESKERSNAIEARKQLDAASAIAKDLENKLKFLSTQYEADKMTLEQTHQEEISLLVSRIGSISECELKTPVENYETVETRQAAVLGPLKEEKKELHKQLLQQRVSLGATPKHLQNQSFFKPLKQLNTSEELFEEDEDWQRETGDSDPEYEPTPVKRFKRSAGLGCGCKKAKFPCKSGMCGCVKRGVACGVDCRCDVGACHNKEIAMGENDDGHDRDSMFVKADAKMNGTFVVPETTKPVKSSTPTMTGPQLFPKLMESDEFDKENGNPDIIPRTPIEGKTTTYKPVYFNSPLNDHN